MVLWKESDTKQKIATPGRVTRGVGQESATMEQCKKGTRDALQSAGEKEEKTKSNRRTIFRKLKKKINKRKTKELV